MGYFQPDDCDNQDTICKFKAYPEYDNLKSAYQNTTASTVKKDSYTPKRNSILTCPAKVSITNLPSTPDGEFL